MQDEEQANEEKSAETAGGESKPKRKKRKRAPAEQGTPERAEPAAEPMEDVATPTAAFGLMRGLFGAAFGLLVVGSGLILLILPFKDTSAPKSDDPPVALLAGAGLFVTLVGWLFLSAAVRKIAGALQSGRYFRVSPTRIRIRVPGDPTWSSLRFGYRMLEVDMSWEDVKSYYPFVYKVNGIPMEAEIVFEHVRGGAYRIPTWHFAESRDEIVARIKDAARPRSD